MRVMYVKHLPRALDCRAGAADETGSGPGLGATVNLPIAFGTSRAAILAAFTAAVEKLADRVRPELVIISAGFDAHRLDPIGSLGLESEDFAVLARIVRSVAQTHCQGRMVSVLEGGYHPLALAECVEAHLLGLAADRVDTTKATSLHGSE